MREWLEKHVSPIVMTDPVWNGGISETRKIAALAETYGVPLVLHNVAGPICHAACMHLGAHIPNLFLSNRCALLPELFPHFEHHGGRRQQRPSACAVGTWAGRNAARDSAGTPLIWRAPSPKAKGLAQGRRAMGDHWAVEAIR
ncbi:MAG: hypothetical protein H6639_08430 [Caldilineaceae bacterium]|nr:hypothetical protein [Caldilineaceae bacterium]